MKKALAFSVLMSLAIAFSGAAWGAPSFVVITGQATPFVTLPADSPGFPEGIAADPDGNIYVGTFSFTVPNVIHIFGRRGLLLDTIPLPAGVLPLGLAFGPSGNLFVADFGNGNVLRFAPPLSAASVPADTIDVCGLVVTACGLNALAFDGDGNLYVSDSFGGNIFQITPGGVPSLFFNHVMLTTMGFPPFGANGLAFNADESALFVANTGDDRILRIGIDAGGAPMGITPFAESINGADGIFFDGEGRLWVAANQGDNVVVLNDAGRVIARLGEFRGIRADGSPIGLLFPASLVMVRNQVFVTNLALPLTGAVGDEPEEDVTKFTISRIGSPFPLRRPAR